MINNDSQKRLEKTLEIASLAGEILMKHWKTTLDITYKKDEFDPVTIADQESDDYIRKAIKEAFPEDSILSEENTENPDSFDGKVWMIDPLDDTKAFAEGLDCFSVSIGCVVDGRPNIGVVYAPARSTFYFGGLSVGGAFMRKNGIEQKLEGSSRSTITESRIIVGLPSKAIRPLNEKVANIPFSQFIEDGSICIALGRLAAGDAECTINTNPRVSKWDSAAGQAIIEAVGGIVTDIHDNPLDYTQTERNWENLVAASANPKIHKEFIVHLNA
ncbi:MAG: 3(2),5-bisphosphate nucleotidase CysQ [Candidatus Nomurabacteria bacterium]|nr:3(2),5-bisphosphate nucleotidase CysQ [Candidatus Nomurabacteria bacterium]